MMFIKKWIYILVMILLLDQGDVFSQGPYRMGTTAASFLEIGVGSVGISLGDAYTASANNLSAIYWNPAGLAHMERSEAIFVYQPWIADINNFFAGFGIVVPRIGTIGLSISGMDYGNDNEVTTLDFQEGTGENYIAYDYAVSMTYARKLVDWFSFGANVKYITSKIWHMEANAAALDLGVQVQTKLFSFTGKRNDGMKIGMSISNYGTRMQYDGIDLLFPEDPSLDENGNYQNVKAKYQTSEWELPLMFRVGVAIEPLDIENQELILSADALHPNNYSEYVNLGMQYKYTMPGTGDFFLRGGYKGLFAHNSQYGPTFGAGFQLWVAANNALKIDYAFHTLSVLGSVHCYTIGFTF